MPGSTFNQGLNVASTIVNNKELTSLSIMLAHYILNQMHDDGHEKLLQQLGIFANRRIGMYDLLQQGFASGKEQFLGKSMWGPTIAQVFSLWQQVNATNSIPAGSMDLLNQLSDKAKQLAQMQPGDKDNAIASVSKELVKIPILSNSILAVFKAQPWAHLDATSLLSAAATANEDLQALVQSSYEKWSTWGQANKNTLDTAMAKNGGPSIDQAITIESAPLASAAGLPPYYNRSINHY
jgi:hypothetical protein